MIPTVDWMDVIRRGYEAASLRDGKFVIRADGTLVSRAVLPAATRGRGASTESRVAHAIGVRDGLVGNGTLT